MKRHDGLIPLTHDHHHALAQARRLGRAATGDATERLLQARDFISFFEDDTLAHFREEEESLFPLVIDEDEAQAMLSQAMLEHLRIHRLVNRLRSSVARSEISSASMTRLAQALSDHIHLEEKALFPMIERLVPQELDDLPLRPRERGLTVSASIGGA